MRLSLSQLEEARRDPARFAARAARPGGMRMSRLRALQYAVYRYHRERADVDEALRYLGELYNRNFKNPDYLAKLEERLLGYVADHKRRGVVTYESGGRVRITACSEPELILTGEIGRADLAGGGRYSAWLLGDKAFAWTGELRMPLLQEAVAARHGVAADAVSVGFYFFETGDYEAETFGNQQIRVARDEVAELARRLADAEPTS